MGSTVGVNLPRDLEILDEKANVLSILQCCNSDYFLHRNHAREYRSAFIFAIKTCHLELIENLIEYRKIYSRCENILPLHFACQYCQLEVVEILISAGYDVCERDDEGRMPLHVCAMTRCADSDLCSAVLIFENKKSVNSKNNHGQTPGHLSVIHNSISVFRILFQNKLNIHLLDKFNKSVKNYAMELNRTEILQILEMKNVSKNRKEKDDIVDIDRIMLVWDKFFENAWKYNDSNPNPNQNSEAIEEWFQWILCYDSNTQEYFVVHRYNYTQVSLQDHIEILKDLNYYPTNIYANVNASGTSDLPCDFLHAMKSGWMMFYDIHTNETKWLNIHSNQTEDYLPIGYDTVYLSVAKLHFYSKEYMNWILPDYACSESWMMVVCDQNNADENTHQYYYLNRILGRSQWNEPIGWMDRTVRCEQNGWILCCYENQPKELFWWNETTNEMVWIG